MDIKDAVRWAKGNVCTTNLLKEIINRTKASFGVLLVRSPNGLWKEQLRHPDALRNTRSRIFHSRAVNAAAKSAEPVLKLIGRTIF